MILYSMTATFGKLEHRTLTLKPGLNVITAPNEWGKSTWCAFLAAMFYGLDTRAKSTKSALAEKERFQPWSGSPMSGRVELNWQGRDITIERSTRGRVPLGYFRAWETETGLEIPELTADNCGAVLLGVERSVFIRTALIRFRELNITDDEALRRRLNNLVTTGDENAEAEHLGTQIKALRNKIRYNRSGLLPAARETCRQLREKLRERELLQQQSERTRCRLDELEDWRRALENHRDHLLFREAREKLALARKESENAREMLETLRIRWGDSPAPEEARQMLTRLQLLQTRQQELRELLQSQPGPEPLAEPPRQLSGLTAEAAWEKVREDGKLYAKLTKNPRALPVTALVLALAGLVCALRWPGPGLAAALAGSFCLVGGMAVRMARRKRAAKLAAFYGSENPRDWERMAREYGTFLYLQSAPAAAARESRNRNLARLKALEESLRNLTQGENPEQFRQRLEEGLLGRESLAQARQRCESARRLQQALEEAFREISMPEAADKLELTAEETVRALQETLREKGSVEHTLGQLQGKMEALGSGEGLLEALGAARSRMEQLEKTYLALTLAQETLAEAAEELQRRFAPRIAAGARQRMEKLTGGNYDRMNFRQDFTVMAASGAEDVLRPALWRSDGTVDQLYLCLRLAVAQALMPEVPLILDDALIRFDDRRLELTMELLKEEAQSRQVIVFTCQGREQQYL